MRPGTFPWLDHLRRDRRGLPVPFVNAWGAETPERTRVEPDPRAAGRLALFHDDHGDEPDFPRQNPGRQRECMVDGLCQVCGKFAPWSRRNLVLAPISVEWSYVDNLRRWLPVIFEPWLCDRCCEIAVGWCPALIRRRREEQLQVVPVRSPREVVPILSLGRVDTVPQAGDGVALWAKVQLLTVDIRRTEPTVVVS